MPKSKVRKKVKQARSNTAKVPREAMTLPVWEYPAAARRTATEMEGQMTEAESLEFLLHMPIRVHLPEQPAPSSLLPAAQAAEAGMSFMEWFESFVELHKAGFMEWDEANMTHYAATPNNKEQEA